MEKRDSLGRRVNLNAHAHLRKHGGWAENRPTYQCWQDMKQRCSNPKHSEFKNYGARGIKVCDRWLTSFPAFLEDMGCKPDGLSLDRLNNDGNYEPSNCRWADKFQQRANQRAGRVVLVRVGDTLFPREVAARMVGLHPATLQARLRRGWPVDKALSTPPQPRTTAMQSTPSKIETGGNER